MNEVWDDENVLKLVYGEYTKSSWILYFKSVNCIVY